MRTNMKTRWAQVLQSTTIAFWVYAKRLMNSEMGQLWRPRKRADHVCTHYSPKVTIYLWKNNTALIALSDFGTYIRITLTVKHHYQSVVTNYKNHTEKKNSFAEHSLSIKERIWYATILYWILTLICINKTPSYLIILGFSPLAY